MREYWAASTMATCVSWWQDFSEECGMDFDVGATANIAAIMQGGTIEMVTITSAAGLVVDLIKHIWSKEKEAN